jgi:hypothetical protein
MAESHGIGKVLRIMESVAAYDPTPSLSGASSYVPYAAAGLALGADRKAIDGDFKVYA